MGCLSTKGAENQHPPRLEHKPKEKKHKEPWDNEKENEKALAEHDQSQPFKFKYKQKWEGLDSTDDLVGPWYINTPPEWGNKLKVKGTIEWKDQGWGGSKG